MMQTAKTTPAGVLEYRWAVGYVHNDMVDERGFAFTNVPGHFSMRYGATDQLDIGMTAFMGFGIMPDVKYNFLPPESPLAVSLQTGFAAASQRPPACTCPSGP
jgi:hypothetical protein